MTTWYSISISRTFPPSPTPIFNGFFSVNNNTPSIVTSFYETINGSTNFGNSILANNSYSDADYVFLKNILRFSGSLGSGGGTNINYMSYYSDPDSPNYNSNYAFFNLFNDVSLIRILDTNGTALILVPTLSTITPISDPSCYNEGTKILCLNKQLVEEYIAIELLRKGDLVKSYKHGYRRVDLIGKDSVINNPEKFTYCMYKMEKTAENGLLEDLIVTGGHVLLVDDLGIYKEKNDKIFGSTPMIDDKYLLLAAISKDFKKIDSVSLYTYYHFTLENNGSDDERFGVWANGILSETVSKKQFTRHKYILL